jgi:hypothetical protein
MKFEGSWHITEMEDWIDDAKVLRCVLAYTWWRNSAVGLVKLSRSASIRNSQAVSMSMVTID